MEKAMTPSSPIYWSEKPLPVIEHALIEIQAISELALAADRRSGAIQRFRRD